MAQSGKRGPRASTRTPVTIDLEAQDISKDDVAKTEEAASTAADEVTADAETSVASSGTVPDPEPVAMDGASAVSSSADGQEPHTAADAESVADASYDAPQSSDDEARAPAAAAAPASAGSSGSGRGLVGGLVGGAIAFAGLFGLQMTGVLPGGAGGGNDGPVAAVDGRGDAVVDLQARFEALSAQVASIEAQPPAAAPQGDFASTEAVAALQARMDAMQDALSSGEGGDTAALETINSRVEALETELATLGASVEEVRTVAQTAGADGASDGAGADPAAIASLNEGLSAVQARLDTVESTLTAAGDAPEAVSAESLAAIQESVAALTTQVESLSQAVSSNATGQETLVSSVETVRQSVEELSGRVQEAEQTLEQSGSGETVARAVAAASLKSAIDRGLPFMPELEAFATVGGSDDAVADLRTYAPGGVPTLTQLVDRFQPVANAIVSAGQGLDEGASIADRLMSSARSLVQVRPVGDVEGESAGAIAARIEARLREGNLQGAISEWESLPDAAKAVSQGFHQDMQARAQVDALISGVLNDAMTATASPAAQQ